MNFDASMELLVSSVDKMVSSLDRCELNLLQGQQSSPMPESDIWALLEGLNIDNCWIPKKL